MAILHEILAVESGAKSTAQSVLTKAHHDAARSAQLTGLSRKYEPLAEDGQVLPAESTQVQIKVPELIARVQAALTKMFDVVATKDATNATARGDVIVDGATLLADVPVTTLLFLEKQLTDLHTFITKLPVLDPSEQWHWDDQRGVYATDPSKSLRMAKVMKTHLLYAATKEHPAQTQSYTEDVPVGTWTAIKFSGALPASRVQELAERVATLMEAVKKARTVANTVPTVDRQIGAAVLGYLFA